MKVGEKKLIRGVARYFSYTYTSPAGKKTNIYKNSKNEAETSNLRHKKRSHSRSNPSTEDRAMASHISKTVVANAYAKFVGKQMKGGKHTMAEAAKMWKSHKKLQPKKL